VKEIVILGGPNGAGKTTAARVLLAKFIHVRQFLNADEIARTLLPDNLEASALAAGRRMIERMRELLREGASFGLETTCSGKSYVRILRQSKEEGWRITLLYLWLKSPEDAIARVAHRVREGGHNIPSEVVRRRYYAGLSNLLKLYLPLADEAEIYDNSDKRRILIAERREGGTLLVHDSRRWARIRKAAQ
jgi:predicted ABC-type ATPase